jgi:ABC-type branched-subunit amino acid transport system substrate-binding protein
MVSMRPTSLPRLVSLFALIGLVAACGARERTPEELPLAYRQAEDAFRLGDYDRAVRGYEVYLRHPEVDDLIPRAYYKLALAEFRRGNYTECVQVLDRMERGFEGRRWPRVYELRGDVEQARGNTISALHWWEMAWLNGKGEDEAEFYQRIRKAISELDDTALAPARAVLESEETRALIDARLRGAGGEAAREPPRTDQEPRREEGAKLPHDAAPPAARVACLLPLSGPYAAYGERSLNGVRLGLGELADQLVVRDTEGRPAVARAAIDELIADPSIVAAIGPLRSEVADSIAVRAERGGLPLVLLSQRQIADGEHVVQPVMTYERQAAQLAEYAVTAMGVARLGVLYPSDGYGSGLAHAFENEFTRRGGRVVGMVAYSSGAREFSVEGLSVQKWIDDASLQGVFIPDYAETAFVLAGELRRAHPELRLLGSNGWNDPGRLGQAGHVLDDAVFVDGFFAASGRRATREFVAAYQQRYQVAPEILDAQAHDAALMIRQALSAGARSRADVVPTLRRVRTIDGASGTIGIGSQGVQRELFLLRYASGRITELLPGNAETAPQALGAADEVRSRGEPR